MARETGVKMFGTWVSNMSTSVGWGGQGGSMRLTLVEDLANDVGISKIKIDRLGKNPTEAGFDNTTARLQPFAGEIIVDQLGNPFTDDLAADAAIADPDSGAYIVGTPQVGTPVYFKYGNFFFGGIFQRYTYNESVGGRTYDIVIESPSKLMDGVQLVIEDWTGDTDYLGSSGSNEGFYSTNVTTDVGLPKSLVTYDNIKNIYNLFGVLENTQVGGIFGGSGFNSAGVECDRLLQVLRNLARRDCLHVMGGGINFKGNEFDLDASEIEAAVNIFWGPPAVQNFTNAYRIKGPTKSINGLMSEIADVLQLDYFYDIVPRCGEPSSDVRLVDEAQQKQAIFNLDDGGGKLTDPVIKVRTVSKQSQPTPNAISRWITDNKANGNIISYNMGKELGDSVTQKLVFGGRRTRYHIKTISEAGSDIQMIYGRTDVSAQATNNSGNFWVDQRNPTTAATEPSRYVSFYLGNDEMRNQLYNASLFEIRMAMGGKKTWEIFKTFETLAGVERNGFNDLQTCPWTGSFDGTKTILTTLRDGEGNCWLLKNTNVAETPNQYKKLLNEKADKIFASVQQVANNWYCQEFLIPLTLHLQYTPQEEFMTMKSWEPCDAAFVQNRATNDLSFFDGNGRQKSMCGWSQYTNYDYSGLGSDYAQGIGSFANLNVSTKGSPDGELLYTTVGISPNHWVNFKAGAVVKNFDPITTPNWGLTVLTKYFFNVDLPPSAYFGIGYNKALQFAIPPDNVLPVRFGIPEQATRYNYGPWLTLAPNIVDGVNTGGLGRIDGKAAIEGNEGLRPENFGGYANLGRMGTIMATVGVGAMTENESGSVELVGAPTGSIGEVFADSGPYCTDISVSVDATGGVKTSLKFNTWTPNFGKLAKYNIDRIAAINKASWDYAKKMRDRVEKRPFPKFKFEKMTLEEGKKQGAGEFDPEGFNLTIGERARQMQQGVGGDGGQGADEGDPQDAQMDI